MEPGAQAMTSRSFQAAAPDPKAQINALSAVIPILAIFIFLLLVILLLLDDTSPGLIKHFGDPSHPDH